MPEKSCGPEMGPAMMAQMMQRSGAIMPKMMER